MSKNQYHKAFENTWRIDLFMNASPRYFITGFLFFLAMDGVRVLLIVAEVFGVNMRPSAGKA